MQRLILPLLLSCHLTAFAEPEVTKAPESAPKKEEEILPKISVTHGSVTIDGQKIPYKATAGKLQIKDDDDSARAAIFSVSYERTELSDSIKRPVMFAFNGGPGSSAVWLHIGVLGPKIIQLPGNGTTAPFPPARAVENPLSLLDVCDLVFIDPVSTGYSRAAKDVKLGQFHGLDGDIESVGDFIRRWIQEHNRWDSPKFLLGESYGGIRAAGLASHLQTRYGMSLNGVVLLSSLLDFATLQSAQGNDLPDQVFLPSLTGVAHFHGKIQGDRDLLVKEATQFAFGDYAAALIQGTQLDEQTRISVAARLAAYSGIDAATWLAHDLRLGATFFRGELLRKEGKVVGRFDGRVAWDIADSGGQMPNYDPSYSLAYGAFSTALLDYLGRELNYKEDRPYEILTGKVQPWSWDTSNEVVNLSDNLAKAMRDNPHLRVLVMGGYTDLATPPEGVAYSIRHMLNLPKNVRGNISTTFYDGGHMFYLNPPDLEKCRKDLVEFIRSAAY